MNREPITENRSGSSKTAGGCPPPTQRRSPRLNLLRRHSNGALVAVPDPSAAVGGSERASPQTKVSFQRFQARFPPVMSAVNWGGS